MNYLQAVNHVLKRLREKTVTTISGNNRALLIGAMVNDAYRMVRERFDFASFHDEINITTASGTSVYTLDGAGPMGTVTFMFDTTNKQEVCQVNADWLAWKIANEGSEGRPRYYAFDEAASDNDPKVVLYPIPSGTFTITAQVETDPETELSADSDMIKVPINPVLKIALYMAREERGDIGQAPGTVEEYADRAIAAAIVTESHKRPEKMQWSVK